MNEKTKDQIKKFQEDGKKYETHQYAKSHNMGRLIIALLAVILIVILVVVY